MVLCGKRSHKWNDFRALFLRYLKGKASRRVDNGYLDQVWGQEYLPERPYRLRPPDNLQGGQNILHGPVSLH